MRTSPIEHYLPGGTLSSVIYRYVTPALGFSWQLPSGHLSRKVFHCANLPYPGRPFFFKVNFGMCVTLLIFFSCTSFCRAQISMKDHLLRLYMEELDQAQMVSPATSFGSLSSDDFQNPPDAEELQQVQALNEKLVQEAQLAREKAEEIAQREQELVLMCVQQVEAANAELQTIRDSTQRREEETAKQSEELEALRQRNSQLEAAHSEMSEEKREMQKCLETTATRQNDLADQVRLPFFFCSMLPEDYHLPRNAEERLSSTKKRRERERDVSASTPSSD